LEKACFSSELPGAALAQLAAIVSPANKPTKEKWSLSWSISAQKIVEKLFCNNGLIRGWLLWERFSAAVHCSSVAWFLASLFWKHSVIEIRLQAVVLVAVQCASVA